MPFWVLNEKYFFVFLDGKWHNIHLKRLFIVYFSLCNESLLLFLVNLKHTINECAFPWLPSSVHATVNDLALRVRFKYLHCLLTYFHLILFVYPRKSAGLIHSKQSLGRHMVADVIMRQFEYFRGLFFIPHRGRSLDANIIVQCLLRARQNIINHFNLNKQKI